MNNNNNNNNIVNTTIKRDTKFKKGNPGGGRPKGSVSLKCRLLKILTPQNADEIAKTLIEMATVDRNVSAIRLVAQMTDTITEAPVGFIITTDMMERAQKYAKDMNYDTNDDGTTTT